MRRAEGEDRTFGKGLGFFMQSEGKNCKSVIAVGYFAVLHVKLFWFMWGFCGFFVRLFLVSMHWGFLTLVGTDWIFCSLKS